MKEERNILHMVHEAQQDPRAADDLIEQYLPFIRSETAKRIGHFPGEYEDALSIAMFAFYEAVMNYAANRGSFLKFAALSIKNRLIDQQRKDMRHEGTLSLDAPGDHEDDRTLGQQLADPTQHPEHREDRIAAQGEIAHFTQTLNQFGLELGDVADNCPGQARTMEVCMAVLDYARTTPAVLAQVESTGKLPMAQLCQGTGADKKTLERHRKYLVAIMLAYTNGFEIIRGHLQDIKRKEAATQ